VVAKSNSQEETSPPATLPQRSPNRALRFLLFWGLLIVGSALSGAALAMMLAAKPLNQSTLNSPNTGTQFTHSALSGLDRPINLLLLGIDNSTQPRSGAQNASDTLKGNSDTMLLVRVLPQPAQINVLSIPRDTLVKLPNRGIDKINDANHLGGAALATQAVSHLVGDVPIDRYIRLDTQGLIALVDALGGVTIDIPKPMDYIDKTQHLKIHFTAGRQLLTGQRLQEYVRFRHDELGDIGRVQRQQVVLRAIAEAIIKPQTLPKLPKLMGVIQHNVDTDLSVEEMLAVAQTIVKTKSKQINFVMLPGRFSRAEEYHLSYWIANKEALLPIVAQYFDESKLKRLNQPISTQALKIAVANASNRAGADRDLVNSLRRQGFSHVYLTDHEIDTVDAGATTQIVAQRGNPQAATAIQKILTVGQVQVASTGDVLSDITVVVGTDLAERLSHQE
jgi:polyisoprenyl-teichoic acid--peptidoglycan teichoic acid transferase